MEGRGRNIKTKQNSSSRIPCLPTYLSMSCYVSSCHTIPSFIPTYHLPSIMLCIYMYVCTKQGGFIFIYFIYSDGASGRLAGQSFSRSVGRAVGRSGGRACRRCGRPSYVALRVCLPMYVRVFLFLFFIINVWVVKLLEAHFVFLGGVERGKGDPTICLSIYLSIYLPKYLYIDRSKYIHICIYKYPSFVFLGSFFKGFAGSIGINKHTRVTYI